MPYGKKVHAPRHRTTIVNGVRLNAHEHKFKLKATAKGYRHTKKGWPDFFCFDSQGKPFVVEVKPRTIAGRLQRLKHPQMIVIRTLEKHGIRCYVSDGETLERYNPEQHDPIR